MARTSRNGFTLIEISIVLVIIGLIVAGILTGRSLIKSAEMNAIISQITKLKTATTTFRLKYGSLPGDIGGPKATSFGLFRCDWDGICGTNTSAGCDTCGENEDGTIYMGLPQNAIGGGACDFECAMFWRHLSQAHLIEGDFGADLDSDGNPTSKNAGGFNIMSKYQPASKLGNNNFIGVASAKWSSLGSYLGNTNNMFYIMQQGSSGVPSFAPTMTPIELYNIDKKIDDGKPSTGSVIAEISSYYLTPDEYYQNAAANGVCVSGVSNIWSASSVAAGVYNTSTSTGGNYMSCVPAFIMQ